MKSGILIQILSLGQDSLLVESDVRVQGHMLVCPPEGSPGRLLASCHSARLHLPVQDCLQISGYYSYRPAHSAESFVDFTDQRFDVLALLRSLDLLGI